MRPAADHFLILGHRGSPRRFPENTLASFEETLRAGADGFETDLRLLSDRTAVLFHDDELREEEIEKLTLAQCAERGAMIDRLDALSQFAGRAMMVLEVKRARWEETILTMVSEWPDIVISSFDHTVIREMRDRGATIPLGITIEGYLVDTAGYAARLGANWCFPQIRYVDRELVDSCHARDVRVMPWTANRKNDWERLRELGCDGVITDFPAEAVAWREKLKIEN